MASRPNLPRTTVLERLTRLIAADKALLEPAALFEEPFSPSPGPAALAAEGSGRLYLLGQNEPLPRDLPETVSPADVTRSLETPDARTLDPRFLPFDHPEGIIARFNRWFYHGKAERAFSEGQMPTDMARDPLLARAEARLLARLAHRSGSRNPKVLKLGAGCEVSSLRLFFEELGRLDAALGGGCEVTFSDISPPLVAEAARQARADPVLARLLERGQLRFRVLDASRPKLAEEKFTLIHSAYLYDSMPQRELARVGGRWYEFKARPRLAAWPEFDQFRQMLLSDDLSGLREVPIYLFSYLDWQILLDPMPPEEVPHRSLLEDICAGAQDIAVPLSDTLIASFEALLPHLSPGGALQTFDFRASSLTPGSSGFEEIFKGPERITFGLILGQNFALARRVFADRGFRTSLLRPDRYLEEMLGEEVIELEGLWAALSLEALEDILGAAFVARFRGCLEGEGGGVFRRYVEAEFLTRSESEGLAAELTALGLDGRGFVEGLFAAAERLADEGAYEQFRVEFPLS